MNKKIFIYLGVSSFLWSQTVSGARVTSFENDPESSLLNQSSGSGRKKPPVCARKRALYLGLGAGASVVLGAAAWGLSYLFSSNDSESSDGGNMTTTVRSWSPTTINWTQSASDSPPWILTTLGKAIVNSTSDYSPPSYLETTGSDYSKSYTSQTSPSLGTISWTTRLSRVPTTTNPISTVAQIQKIIPADGGFLNFEKQGLCQSDSAQMCFETFYPPEKGTTAQETKVEFLGNSCVRRLFSCPHWLSSLVQYESQCFKATCNEVQQIPGARLGFQNKLFKNKGSQIIWRFVALKGRTYFPYSQNAMTIHPDFYLREKDFITSLCKSQLMTQKIVSAPLGFFSKLPKDFLENFMSFSFFFKGSIDPTGKKGRNTIYWSEHGTFQAIEMFFVDDKNFVNARLSTMPFFQPQKKVSASSVNEFFIPDNSLIKNQEDLQKKNVEMVGSFFDPDINDRCQLINSTGTSSPID